MSTRRSPRRRTADPRAAVFALLAGVLAAAVACLAVGSFLSWLAIPTSTGGYTHVSGTGAVSGDSQLAGENLNDSLTGFGSFRPGWVTIAIAIAVLLVGAATVLARSSRKAALRLSGGLSAIFGAVGCWWSIQRLIEPDPSSLGSGAASAGAGPILTLVGSVLTVLAAGMLLSGLLDPRERSGPGHRGIQPSR